MIAIARIRYRCSECCGVDEMVSLDHGVRSVLEMTRHFAPHDECYRVISGRSRRFGEIGRKMWLTPTGRVSLEFYDKTKHAFMTGCIVHVPYPTAPVWGKGAKGRRAKRAAAPPAEAVEGYETGDSAEAEEDVAVADMVFAREFDEALTALDDAHAKVMLMVRKQRMRRPNGYFCTRVDLTSLARQVQRLEAALEAEHGAT